MSILDKLGAEVFVQGKPLEQCQYPGLREHRVVADGLAIDYDLPVAMCDGIIIRVDLYRPSSSPGR